MLGWEVRRCGPAPDSLPMEMCGTEGGVSCSPITIVHNLLDEVHNFWHIFTDTGQDIRRENLWGQSLSAFSWQV